MRKILFKIKKFFLIILSFLCHLLFGTKKGEDKELFYKEKGTDSTIKGSKENFSFRPQDRDDLSLSIGKQIQKVYIIKKRVDKIFLLIKVEQDKVVLAQLFTELENYKEEIMSIEKEMEKSTNYQEEKKEFIDIVKEVKQELKNTSVSIKKQLENKEYKEYKEAKEVVEKEDENIYDFNWNQEIYIKEVEQEITNEKNLNSLENISKDSKEIDKTFELDNLTETKVKSKTFDDFFSSSTRRENLKQNESKLITKKLEEKICIKEIENKIVKSVKKDIDKRNSFKKQSSYEKKPSNIKHDNKMGIYQLRIQHIRNIMNRISVSQQRKVLKKVVLNLGSTLILMTSLNPSLTTPKKRSKAIAMSLMMNNKIRESKGFIRRKKIRKLNYQEVIQKTNNSGVEVHLNYILSDFLIQIRELRSLISQCGITDEVIDLLSQLDELEFGLLEKMNNLCQEDVQVKRIVK